MVGFKETSLTLEHIRPTVYAADVGEIEKKFFGVVVLLSKVVCLPIDARVAPCAELPAQVCWLSLSLFFYFLFVVLVCC